MFYTGNTDLYHTWGTNTEQIIIFCVLHRKYRPVPYLGIRHRTDYYWHMFFKGNTGLYHTWGTDTEQIIFFCVLHRKYRPVPYLEYRHRTEKYFTLEYREKTCMWHTCNTEEKQYVLLQRKNRVVTNMENRAKPATIFSGRKHIGNRYVIQFKTRIMYYRKKTDPSQICETNFYQNL